MSDIEKYMPDSDTKLVQAPIGVSLYDKVNKLRQKKGWTWPVLIEALFKRLLAENKD
jgi:hypothetical protein